MSLGLTFKEAMVIPIGKLMDLISIELIMNKGMKEKMTAEENEAEFERLMSFK